MRTAEIKPVRLASLDALLETVIPAHIEPVPTKKALRNLLDRYNIPRFKPNPHAERGGGTCLYSVPHVERLLRQLLPPGRLA